MAKNNREERVWLGLQFQGGRIHNGRANAWRPAAGIAAESSYLSPHMGSRVKTGDRLWTLKACPQWCTSSSNASLTKPSQTALVRNYVFERQTIRRVIILISHQTAIWHLLNDMYWFKSDSIKTRPWSNLIDKQMASSRWSPKDGLSQLLALKYML